MVPCGNPPLIELTNQKKPCGHNPCTCMWTNIVPRHHHLLPSNPGSQHSRPPWQPLLRHHRPCTAPRELHRSVIVSHGCASFMHLRLFEASHHHPPSFSTVKRSSHRSARPSSPQWHQHHGSSTTTAAEVQHHHANTASSSLHHRTAARTNLRNHHPWQRHCTSTLIAPVTRTVRWPLPCEQHRSSSTVQSPPW